MQFIFADELLSSHNINDKLILFYFLLFALGITKSFINLSYERLRDIPSAIVCFFLFFFVFSLSCP
jgi:hypothetical protein